MIERIATILITASSVLLFGYWFRYTCLLVLNTKTVRDYASEVAAVHQLGFLEDFAALGLEKLRPFTGQLAWVGH